MHTGAPVLLHHHQCKQQFPHASKKVCTVDPLEVCKHGTRLNMQCIDGRCTFANMALRTACARGSVRDVLTALRAGADVHENNEAAFCAACAGGHVDMARLLLSLSGSHRVDTARAMAADMNPFQLACANGHVKMVQLLLALEGERRVNVHAGNERALGLACWGGHTEVVRLLLRLEGERRVDVHALGEGAFQWACERGHTQIVQLLLQLGGDRRVNVHVWNEVAFRTVCERGYTDTVRLLLRLRGERMVPAAVVVAKGQVPSRDGVRWARRRAVLACRARVRCAA